MRPDEIRQRLVGTAAGRADCLLAAGLAAFSGVVFAASFHIPPPFFDPLGSAAVPQFVAAVLALLAVALCVQRALTSPEPATADAAETFRPTPVHATLSLVVVVAYTALMQFGILDFAQASTLLVLALGAVLARFRGLALVALVPLALVIGYGFEHLFTRVFYIDLPQRSILEGLAGAG